MNCNTEHKIIYTKKQTYFEYGIFKYGEKYNGNQCCPTTVWSQIFFKISSFEFSNKDI